MDLSARHLAGLRRVAVASALVLVLVGCGTTVPLGSHAAPSDGLSGGSELAHAADTNATGTGQGAGTRGATGALSRLPAATAATAASEGVSGSTGTGGGPPGAAAGPVASGTGPIRVGIFYLNGGNQVLASAFPGSSVAFGNGQSEAQALVDDVNRHGGIAGRPIKASFIAVQATDTSDTARQQACQGAVQDSHPVVLLSMFNIGRGLAACAQQQHTLLLDVALGSGDDYLFRTASDYLFTPTQISRNREQSLVLGLAHAEGRISPSTKVGILSEDDDPMYDRVASATIQPLLKRWGVPAIQEDLSSGADSSGSSSAVLKFKTAGVTRVVFSLGSGGIPETLFMQAAQRQAFFPKYLMGDSTDTGFLSGSAPASEAQGIWGAGTMPLANVTAAQYPTTPSEQNCLNIMNASFGPGYKNRGSSLTSTLYCDLVFSFVEVAKTVRGALDATSWVSAYRSFATQYRPVTTFATAFSAANNDGASEYREFSWNTGCSCVSYSSPVRPIP